MQTLSSTLVFSGKISQLYQPHPTQFGFRIYHTTSKLNFDNYQYISNSLEATVSIK